MNQNPMPGGAISPTQRQMECLQIICEWFDTYGECPSYRELARELDSPSTGSPNGLVNGLAERGWLTIGYGKSRSIQILRRPPMPDFSEIEWSLAESLAAAGDPSTGSDAMGRATRVCHHRCLNLKRWSVRCRNRTI